jgi:hypothetical protein
MELFAEPVSIVSHCGDLTTPGHLTRGWTIHLSMPKTPWLADAPGSFLWYHGRVTLLKGVMPEPGDR